MGKREIRAAKSERREAAYQAAVERDYVKTRQQMRDSARAMDIAIAWLIDATGLGQDEVVNELDRRFRDRWIYLDHSERR